MSSFNVYSPVCVKPNDIAPIGVIYSIFKDSFDIP